MLEGKAQIRSASRVLKQVEDSHDVKSSVAKISKVMRENEGLRYGKVKKLPKQANSLRNLGMRQSFALKVLDLLSNGTRILNVDETWIG